MTDTESNTAAKCECFNEMLMAASAKIRPQLPEGAADISIGWQNRTFIMSGGDYSIINPKIEVEFRKPKKAGGHAQNVTRDTVSIMANYCVFCGRKYLKSEAQS